MSDIIQYQDIGAVGQAANLMASQSVFTDFQSRKAKNTLRRQRDDLAVFETYLHSIGVEVSGLFNESTIWQGLTWGTVKGFVSWMVLQGYALSSVNHRLTTVRTYANLANQAGVISGDELLKIKAVKGYASKEASKVNEKRAEQSIPTRLGAKKAETTSITKSELENMIDLLPENPQGRRDKLMILLMAELGLRVGELQSLEVGNFDLDDGIVTFYRQKVGITQTTGYQSDY